MRIFALDRIQSMSMLDKKFKYPKDFSPAEFLLYSCGIFHDDKILETLRILATHVQVNYLCLLPMRHTQEEVSSNEEGGVFEYRVKISYDLELKLLSYIDHIQVLAPLWLRDKMKRRFREALEKY